MIKKRVYILKIELKNVILKKLQKKRMLFSLKRKKERREWEGEEHKI